MKAQVLRKVQGDLSLESIPTPAPGPGEVLVKVAACGVCHTDLHVIKGEVAFPTPCVLGHEISGTIEALGDGTTGFHEGDRVVCSFIMPCGTCRHCLKGQEDLCEEFFAKNRLKGHLYDGSSRLVDAKGGPLAMYSMAGLAEYAVLPASAVFALPDDVDLETAAILGCSVFTSYGAVRNVAKLQPGETVAVVAAGGIGLNIIQMAAALGAGRIIAVDISDEKLILAKEMGATDTVNSLHQDATQTVRELTGSLGVDIAFEAFGSAGTVETALELVDDGGRVVLVGIAPAGVKANLDIARIVRRKIQVLGSYGARASTDMPEVIRLAASGKIKLNELITDRYALEDADQAYKDLDNRVITGRAIITADG